MKPVRQALGQFAKLWCWSQLELIPRLDSELELTFQFGSEAGAESSPPLMQYQSHHQHPISFFISSAYFVTATSNQYHSSQHTYFLPVRNMSTNTSATMMFSAGPAGPADGQFPC